MSDLISRSEVIDVLKQTGIIQDNDLGHLVIDEIDRISTAYDIEKVVDELEQHYDDDSVICGLVYNDAIKKAIEIVKHGCVDDDVCEWEKGFSGYVGYPAYYSKCCTTNSKGLEMQTHIIADWKYCPYCGKKIKAVE